MIFAIVRLGTQIALPGIDTAGVIAARENASMAGTLYSVIAGGANSSWSIFAMGIGPYINASIIMQLLTIAIPKFEQLHNDGCVDVGAKDTITCIWCIVLWFMLHLYFVWYAAPHLLCGWRSRLLQAESATVPL